MSYSSNHKSSMCDKCLADVGEKNLKPVPFLYLDKNDHIHPDMSPKLRQERRKQAEETFKGDNLLIEMWLRRNPVEDGYRQYRICKNCKP